MMQTTLNVMGVPMKVDYGTMSTGNAKEITVSLKPKDNNQTEFNIVNNPTKLPPQAIRVLVRALSENILRTRSLPEKLYIIVED